MGHIPCWAWANEKGTVPTAGDSSSFTAEEMNTNGTAVKSKGVTVLGPCLPECGILTAGYMRKLPGSCTWLNIFT